MKVVYLDHAATTPLHPDVLQSMLPYYIEHFGNPSSIHAYGRITRQAIVEARESIATALHASPLEIIFTSGGTESNNLAIYSAISTARKKLSAFSKLHVITSSIEHQAVHEPLQKLSVSEIEITYLPVNDQGLVSLKDVEQAIQPNTVLISVMYGNNEVGTVQPIREIGELARAHHIPFHVDAVQVLGKLHIDLSTCHVDFMSFSAHKINGPKGIGALYVASKNSLVPQQLGGSQEKKRRAGTENVAGIVGFAKALEIAVAQLSSYEAHMNRLRAQMISQFQAQCTSDQYVINGHPDLRLPHILHMSFPGVSTESMIMNLDLQGIAVSSGSACSSGSLEVSHVLKAMHVPPQNQQSAIRFSFGNGNSEEDILYVASQVIQIVRRIQNRL